MRFAGIILACTLSAMTSQMAYAAKSLSPAESTICKSVKHCVDIVDRHAPDAYDYAALHNEFLRFGTKGKTALLKMLSDKSETDMQRAQAILAKGRFRFTPDEQREIAALWPRGDLDTHAKIMLDSLSPLMRARAIDTLNSKNETVRAFSRQIIDATVKMKMDFPLKSSDFGAIARAALTAPTPGLIELLSSYGPIKTDPIFARVLQSGDAPSTIAAYEKLFKTNPEKAFKSLVGTLYALKDNQADAAFAIAALLRRRHASREDGFYLKFASDIAQDPKMSAMGRMAGLDAIIGKHHQPNDPILETSSLVLASFKTALENSVSLNPNYIANVLTAKNKTPDPWLGILWARLETDPYKNPALADVFFNQLGKISTPLAKSIVDKALTDKRDFGLINLAIKASVKQGDKSRIPALKQLLNHPVTDVGAYAQIALEDLSKGQKIFNTRQAAARITALNKEAKTCRAKPKDFKTDVKNLPFFDLKDDFVELGGPRRNYVSTVHPTKSGWLVGYAAGEWGGDLQYYDNISGKGTALKYVTPEDKLRRPGTHNNIQAIVPVMPQPLGKYATEFWVFMTDGGFTNNAAIYKLSETADGFQLKRHAQLPQRRLQIAPQKSGDIFISFYDNADKYYTAHPPLLLSPNGSMQRACNVAPINEATFKKASP